MGTDTKGRILGRVSHEEVLNFIKQKYDQNAVSFVKLEDYGAAAKYDFIKDTYDDSGHWRSWYGFITFKYDEEVRSLFYSYDNMNSYENLKYYSEFGLEEMVKSETTHISFPYNPTSITIIKEIVAHFGGWIDENDCDNIPYYPVIKNEDGTIKPCIVVTMEEIYEKFGGVVVIKDR